MIQEPQGRCGKWPQSKSEQQIRESVKRQARTVLRQSDNDCESADVMGEKKYNSSALNNSHIVYVQDNNSIKGHPPYWQS